MPKPANDMPPRKKTSPKPERPHQYLVARIAENQDKEAFKTLYTYYAPRLQAFMIRQGCSETVAEDIVQDTLTQLWVKAKQFNPDKARLATWLYTMARNRRIDLLRRKNTQYNAGTILETDENIDESLTMLPHHDPANDPNGAMLRKQHKAFLLNALRDIPGDQQSLILQAFYGELSHSDLAERTGLPLGTIKSRLRLGMKKLANRLQHLEKDLT